MFPPTQESLSRDRHRSGSPLPQKKSDVFKVPDSPPPPRAYQNLIEIEEHMNVAKDSRTLTKVDLSILASLEQAKGLQKELDTLQRGKVIIF